MLFGPQRGSAFTIFDKFASTFGLTIVIIALALIFRDTQALMQNGAILVIALITPVARLLKYLFTYYSIDEEKFYVKSGIFNKSNLELPLDRITTVDFTQNLIFQWLGVYSIKVDNASNYGGNGVGKVELALKKADALRMKGLLLSKKYGSSEVDLHAGSIADIDKEGTPTAEGATVSSYTMADGSTVTVPGADGIMTHSEDDEAEVTVIPARNILIMGALQAKGNAVAQVISVAAVLGGMINIIIGKEMGFEDRLIDFILAIPGLGVAVILIVAFLVLSTVFGALFALIKYYGFKIRNGEKSIYLEYGLFTKKNHSLLKEKISGVEFVQSLPMRLLKVGYLNVLAVGYGDIDSGEKAMMYPLIAEAQTGSFVSRYIPEIYSAPSYEKPLKRSWRYFFICFRFFFVLALVAAAVAAEAMWGFVQRCPADISWIWVMLGVFLILAILSVIAEYKNTGVYAGKKNVHFVAGGFTRIRTAIKTENIESLSDKGSVWKRGNGIVSIKMGILAPEMDSVKEVRNMPLQAFENLKNVIHY